MSANRITLGGATLAALLIAAALAGCGGGGSSTTTATEAASVRSPDADLLDHVLARQEAAVVASAETIPHLSPQLAHMASYFRAQEQEHVDATIKALRGLGSPVEASAEPIAAGDMKSDRERLEFLYAVEGATIDEELSAISKLEASWPRSLLASTAANQAQHLTLLRRELGAGPLRSIPGAFEDGTFPPPVG
jgi:Ferritin-like domain